MPLESLKKNVNFLQSDDDLIHLPKFLLILQTPLPLLR